MTRALAPLYLAAGMVAGLWGGQAARVPQRASPANEDGARGNAPGWMEAASSAGFGKPTPAGMAGSSLPETGALLSQLDALDARIAALAYPDPRHCDDACLTGVERVELRRGVVSCRCRKLPSLGVHRLPEAGR